MEFYVDGKIISVVQKLFQFPTGWNSTIIGVIGKREVSVSIPNGMEFYIAIPAAEAFIARFNSQRDGILLYLWSNITF